MLKGATIVVSLFVCFLSGAQTKRTIEKILKVSNGAIWGDWANDVEFCDEDTYAVGFRMLIERYQGEGDDSSLNGIEVICQNKKGGATNKIKSKVGPWGDWRGVKYCKHYDNQKQFLTSFTLKVEPNQDSGDDTGANAVTFRCRNFDNTGMKHMINDDPKEYNWGSYGSWSESCGKSSAICGMITSVERYLGDGDDSALNDVQFVCCKYYN